MLNDFIRTLVTRSEHFARRAYSLGKAGVSAAHDHAKLWALGTTVVLKFSGFFFVVPFTTTTNYGLRTLRVGTRFHQYLTWVCNVIGGLRVAFYICITFEENFKWYSRGQFTADASFFVVWFLWAFGGYLAHVVMLYQKQDFVFLCNAASRLNKTFSEEHLGTWDVMNVARGKFIVVACAGAGCLCMFMPALIAFIVLFLRWSPIMLPYHIFGDKYQLMEMEAQWSLPYGSALVLDWCIFTGGSMAIYTAAVICADAMLRIILICKALRDPCGQSLNWQEKRFYHIQLEILLNALHTIVGKFTPLMVLGLSILATSSTIMLLHVNPLNEGQGCAPCAFLLLLGFAVCAWLGGVLIFHSLEQLSEESAAVLRDVTEEITLKTKASRCVYGDELVPRSFPARLFRRRILRIKIGEFNKMESGFALAFFQSTADNIVTYVFMVNPTGHMWLL